MTENKEPSHDTKMLFREIKACVQQYQRKIHPVAHASFDFETKTFYVGAKDDVVEEPPDWWISLHFSLDNFDTDILQAIAQAVDDILKTR